MQFHFLLQLGLLGVAAAQTPAPTLAKSYTGWDCCKNICSSDNGVESLLDTRGVIKTCDANNNVFDLESGLWVDSGCNDNGSGFMCADLAPFPVSEELSYGFAVKVVDGNHVGDNPDCCKCYEVEWMTGSAADLGKKMLVQVVAPGGGGGDVVPGDFIILTPGGGVGPIDTGCSRQYGAGVDWGSEFGGFTSRDGCGGLPEKLQGGCYWRFNWARGDINTWDISYRQIVCPEELTSISGCVNNNP